MINLSPNEAASLPIDALSMHVLKDIAVSGGDTEYSYLYRYNQAATSLYKGRSRVIIAEALTWLRSHAMIAHDPDDSRPDSIMVTRWGQQALELDLKDIKAIHRLQDNLHPLILQKARQQFLLGEYENAIFVSMKAVEVRVRNLSGLGDELIGVDLMTKAFKQDGPLVDKNAPKGEVEGTMKLFAGAYAVLRNPSGHRDIEFDDVTEASEAVITASLLMRILDKIENRLSENSK